MNAIGRGIRASGEGGIGRIEPGTVVRRFRFAPGFIGFSGHFPGNPILPAIVQVYVVVSLAEEEEGKTLRLAEIQSAKFLSPIRPDEEVSVRYHRRVESGKNIYDATLSVGGKTSATFHLRLVPEGEAPR
jgi:3-hydroxyacyl-[acyl-carrier-protein] dehydratase